MDFSQTGVTTSPMYALPVILFSASVYVIIAADSCHNLDLRHDLHKFSDTQLIYIESLKKCGLEFFKLLEGHT